MQYANGQRITNRADVLVCFPFAVVKSCLCVWCRGPSCPVRWRSEQGRGPKAHDGSPQTAPANCGEVNTARKIRRAQRTEMRDAGRATSTSCPGARVHLHAVSRAPCSVIAEQMLPLVEAALVELKQHEGSPEKYGNGSEFWDDWCLERHLEGACLRYIAYPVHEDRQHHSSLFPHLVSFA
jgi:hypothetical protein